MKATEKAISFIPRRLLSLVSEGINEVRFPAVVAFADASGFTKMSEQLATIGKEGAEALTGILNNYFTAMISRIELAGGFVGKFGGDAMTIFFPVDENQTMIDVAKRAAVTALCLQDKMVDFQHFETKAGVFALGMKIGIAAGDVIFRIVGPEQDGAREYLLAGIPLDRAAEAEHHGVSGEVILTPKVADLCQAKGDKLEDGFLRLAPDSMQRLVEPVPDRFTPKSEWADIAKMFIDPPVYNRMKLGMDSVGEIRRVSVIFMSFTGLDYDIDDKVGQKLEEIYNWVYSLTSRYGGSINKVDMGDKGSKMIITFGTPIAQENDEELAVLCGLELVRGHEKIKKMGVEQRLGIATGVVFTGEVGAPSRQEYTVMGSVVNLSARMMAHSHPGQLLVDEATYERVKDIFEYNEPEFVQFKGIKEPLPTYTVVGLKAKTQRPVETERKPLIGRRNEIARVGGVLENVLGGKLQVLIIRGDAGTGKTRLAQEILDISKEKGFIISAGEALSYAKRSPYLVWISVLRRIMELPAAGGGKEVLQRLEQVVTEADPENAFRVPIVAGLLGMECPDNDITRHFDAQLRQENLFDFIIQYFKYLTQTSPLLLLFEDCQWIDKMSLELISYLIRNLADYPVLFLNVRRAYSRKFVSPHIGDIEKSLVTTAISLTDLNPDATEQLTLQTLGADSIDRELMKFIFDSSHGNASFTEQLIENLRSLNKIKVVTDPEKDGKLAEKIGDLSDVEVPDSLSSLIMSQLDRLQPEAKLTVKVAAVIGRQFQKEVMTGSYPVAMNEVQIQHSIDELKVHEIVGESEDQNIYDYIFKNLLTRDVAYDSLLFAHRREYHKRIGSCLETMHEDSLTEWYEELARHFYQSDDDNRATKYLYKAGNKAYELYANDSAEDFYSKALERAIFEKFENERIQLLTMRSEVYAITGKNEQQEKDLSELLELTDIISDLKSKIDTLGRFAYLYFRTHQKDKIKMYLDQAHEILTKIDYPNGRITIYNHTGTLYLVQNKYDQALKYYKKSSEAAMAVNDQPRMSVALSNCGRASSGQGNFDQALEYYNQSLSIDREVGNKKSEALNLGNIGVLYHQRGAYDEALEAYQQALEIGRSIGSKLIQSNYIGNLALIYQIKGERDRALASYKELHDISNQMGFPRGQIGSLINIGSWYLEYANFNKAISYYEQALEVIRKYGFKDQEPQGMLNIGLVLHYQGKLDQARDFLERAVKLAIEANSKPSEDYARRYLGFVLIDQGDLDEAEEQFHLANDIASALGSKSSLASVKVGIGLIQMLQGQSKELLEEGITEARKLGDKETFLKGQISLAKVLIDRGEKTPETLELLEFALKIAKSSGLKNDVGVIEPLIAKIKDSVG